MFHCIDELEKIRFSKVENQKNWGARNPEKLRSNICFTACHYCQGNVTTLNRSHQGAATWAAVSSSLFALVSIKNSPVYCISSPFLSLPPSVCQHLTVVQAVLCRAKFISEWECVSLVFSHSSSLKFATPNNNNIIFLLSLLVFSQQNNFIVSPTGTAFPLVAEP